MPIRVPTRDPHAWWRRALSDPSTPRHDDEPEAGLYVRRALRDGPLEPVEIRLVQEIDPETGELTEPERFEAVGTDDDDLSRLWRSVLPVRLAEFHAVKAAREGAPWPDRMLKASHYRVRFADRGPFVPARTATVVLHNGRQFPLGVWVNEWRHDDWPDETRQREKISREEYDALLDRHRADDRMSVTHAAYDVGAAPTRPTRGAY